MEEAGAYHENYHTFTLSCDLGLEKLGSRTATQGEKTGIGFEHWKQCFCDACPVHLHLLHASLNVAVRLPFVLQYLMQQELPLRREFDSINRKNKKTVSSIKG